MKLRHVMTAALGALMLSCQGPAAVLAQEAAAGGVGANSPAAITAAHRERALDTLHRRLAHYVMVERTPAIRARLAERRQAYLALTDPEAFRQAINADLLAVSGDNHLQVWIEGRSRDDAAAEGPGPTLEQMAAEEARNGWGVREAKMLDGGVAYLNLASFSGHPDSAAAIDATMARLAGARALVLDLRENLGGGEAALRQLMGHFAPQPMRLEDIQFRRCQPNPADPEDCVADGRDVFERFANPVAAPTFPSQPILVLVGPGTFSAAEAVAYDLQAAARATVIGEPTGGGANPSIAMDLGPWFTVIMPIGEARHPVTGTNWEGGGVRPDVAVPAGQALAEALRRIG
ncbi:S41 family peptidase [Brevundimonas sp.]|uniref:S41 family peptidase n=1 Tax=Brevundimonas sp. TaxID=1871086 RepID=UPI002D6ED14C|nr:S41 family peptidase [Brevundimonas sp.]HYC67333.1 S41 family peptidase [Brevundimonas sp.]